MQDPGLLSRAGNTGVANGVEPLLNVWANADQALLTAELPGIAKDEIDITVLGNTVTLACAPRSEDDTRKSLLRERKRQSTQRSLKLPFGVDADRVEATLEAGVLTVRLPREEAEKPFQIVVK